MYKECLSILELLFSLLSFPLTSLSISCHRVWTTFYIVTQNQGHGHNVLGKILRGRRPLRICAAVSAMEHPNLWGFWGYSNQLPLPVSASEPEGFSWPPQPNLWNLCPPAGRPEVLGNWQPWKQSTGVVYKYPSSLSLDGIILRCVIYTLSQFLHRFKQVISCLSFVSLPGWFSLHFSNKLLTLESLPPILLLENPN